MLRRAAWRTRPYARRARAQGTADKPPEDPRLLHALLALDVCFSTLTVGFWIEKTYHYGLRQWVAVVELVFAAFYLLDYFVRLARRGFAAGAPWQASCLLDAFCAVPLLLQGTTNRAWLSLTYTRSLAVMWAFEALHASGATARMSELRVRLIQAVLRLGALVFCFAGTMLIVECAFPRYRYCGCCLHALNACAIHSASRSFGRHRCADRQVLGG